MEIEDLSNSTSWLLVSYFRTRFPAWLVVSLPLTIVLPALASGAISSAGGFALAFGMALLLVVEFRLRDDLHDQEQDCREDPSRVLCRVESLAPFVWLLFTLAVVNLALVVWRWELPPLAMLIGLHFFLGRWYTVRSRWQLGPVVNYHLVLLKYPAFGFVLGYHPRLTDWSPLFAPLAVVYLGLCIAEVLHDRRLRSLNAAWICLGREATVLGGILAWWSTQLL